MNTLFFVMFVFTFICSAIAAFTSILTLIFKKTRLFKAKKLEALRKELEIAEKKLKSVVDAYNRGDDGLKLVMEPMVADAKLAVETIKDEINKVETKKK